MIINFCHKSTTNCLKFISVISLPIPVDNRKSIGKPIADLSEWNVFAYVSRVCNCVINVLTLVNAGAGGGILKVYKITHLGQSLIDVWVGSVSQN